MDFLEIAKSWLISFNPNEEQQKIADSRIEICNSCEERKHHIFYYCGKCGCPLDKKIYSPNRPDSCPAGKWVI